MRLLVAWGLLLAAPGLAGPQATPTAAATPTATATATAAPAAQGDRDWAVATSRMLGAAGTMRDRAWRLRESAQAVSDAGRVGAVSALVADVRELDRAVVSATLAAQVLAQASPPAP